MNKEEIENRFTYHAPKPGQPAIYEQIRYTAKELAICICALTPESREQSLAITALEESVFWANAAIARHPLEQQSDPNTLYPDVLTTSHAAGSSSPAHMTDEPEFQGTRRLHIEEDDTP